MISISSEAWINAAIAAIGAALVFRAMNRMNGVTDHAMRFSFALIGAGLAGEAFSTLLPDAWQEGIDTLLFGGLLAAFLGTRRVPAMIPGLSEMWRVRLSVGTCAITFAAFLAGVV
jgi:hypothetical protein